MRKLAEIDFNSIADDILNAGGSWDYSTGMPSDKTTGYFVSDPSDNVPIPVEQWGADTAAAEFAARRDNPDNEGKFFGGWNDNGIYLDNSNWVEDLDEALALGKQNDQLAIWDVANGAEIFLDGRTAAANLMWANTDKVANKDDGFYEVEYEVVDEFDSVLDEGSGTYEYTSSDTGDSIKSQIADDLALDDEDQIRYRTTEE